MPEISNQHADQSASLFYFYHFVCPMEEIASICYKKFSSYYPPHLVEWYIQTSYDNYAWSFEFKLYKNTEKQRVIIVYSESLDLAYVSDTGATLLHP